VAGYTLWNLSWCKNSKSLEMYVNDNSHFSGHKYLSVMIKTISSGGGQLLSITMALCARQIFHLVINLLGFQYVLIIVVIVACSCSATNNCGFWIA
jgi:hypothetical protein